MELTKKRRPLPRQIRPVSEVLLEKNMKGYLHSLQSLGTVDGPGVRAVVFAAGCPLRCSFCHNPDTWHISDGDEIDHEALAKRIIRLYEYIKDGGVTFSGGEPCMQARFFTALAKELKEHGLHIALDTSGAILDDATKELLSCVDLVLLDVKFTDEESYTLNTGGRLAEPLAFLDYCESIGLPVWIRHVVIPGVNDTREDLTKLRELISPYENVTRVELLPFKKLCIEKYELLDIPFHLSDTPQMSEDRLLEISHGIFD